MKERAPARLTVLPAGSCIPAHAGDTILDALLDHGIDLPHECGGNCSCTTCHVHILAGAEHLSPVEEAEAYRVQFADGHDGRSRLACQALLRGGDVTISPP